jgi:hypothetical protein
MSSDGDSARGSLDRAGDGERPPARGERDEVRSDRAGREAIGDAHDVAREDAHGETPGDGEARSSRIRAPSPGALGDRASCASTRFAWIVALALAIPILAARFGWLRWMEYSGDEEYFVVHAFEAIHRGVGYGYPTSTGMRAPPFFVYLVGVPLAFTHDPVLVVAFIAALNVVGLLCTFFFARALLGSRSAILVTLLMAASPWSILFSRKIWSLDAMFPLVAALHFVVFSNLCDYRRWKVLLAFVLFAAASQIHPSALLLAIPFVALYTLLRAPVRLVDVALGLGVAALSYAPYLGYLVATGFDSLRYASSLRAKGGGESIPLVSRLLAHGARPFEISSGMDLHALLGFGARPSFLAHPTARLGELVGQFLFVATILSGIAAVTWSASRIRGVARGAATNAERYLVCLAITLVWSIATAAVLGVFPNQHYYVFLYPIVPIFFVWGLERARAILRATTWTAIAIVGAIAAVQVALMLAFFASLPRDPDVANGSLSVFYAPKSAACERELERKFDDVLHGEERQRVIDADRASRFETSTRTLLRVDTTHDGPTRDDPTLNASRIVPHGAIDIDPTPEGFVIRGGSALDMAALPEFHVPQGAQALVRIELTSPDDAILMALYQTRSDPTYSHRKLRDAHVKRGRSTVFLEFDDSDLSNRVLLRFEVYRYVIHALEVRAVDR